jgi:hypothetical protein
LLETLESVGVRRLHVDRSDRDLDEAGQAS